MTGFISEDTHVHTSDSAKINRVPGGFTIPPLDRPLCHPRLLAIDLKSASVIGYGGGWTNIIIHHCEYVTDVLSAPSSVRHFFQLMTSRANGTSATVSGGSVPTQTASVPRTSGNQRTSTEEPATRGSATGGQNDFRKEQQCVEE